MKSIKSRIDGFLENRSQTGSAFTALLIAAVLVVNIILCFLTQSFGWYFYQAKYQEDFTISGKSDELLSEAKEAGRKVTVTFLMERDALREHSTGSFVIDTFEQFEERYGDFITLRFVNTLTKLDQDGKRVDLEKYKTDMKGNEVGLSRTAVIFESDTGSHRTLSNVQGGVGFVDFFTFDSTGEVVSFNGETVISSMISWVLVDEHKTVYLTANHAEENNANFTTLLASSGYYINSINLQDSDGPSDAAMVIISNPKNDFERAKAGSGIKTEIERLEDYVKRGGNLYISLDPYVKRLDNLEDFIMQFGIELSGAVAPSGSQERHIVRDAENAVTLDGYTLLAEYATGGVADAIRATVEKYSAGNIILRDAAALKLDSAKGARAILKSSQSSELTLGGDFADGAGGYTIAAYSSYDAGDGKTAGIFVIPSVYASASDALTSNSYANRDFLYSLFEHVFGAKNLPYGANSVIYVDDVLRNLTMGTARLYSALLLAIPAVLAVVGGAIIIRRKNR